MPLAHRIASLLAALALTWVPVTSADTVITVGVYNFPPIASVNAANQAEGLLGDLLNQLEAVHADLSFRIFYPSPKRRHLDFQADLYDVIFFESPKWGWSGLETSVSAPVLTDEELYVALKKPGRTLDFFDNIADHRIVAMSGYHYSFADFETDSDILQQRFDIEFSSSHSRNLQLIKADRPSVAEIAIVSRSYLQQHLSENPGDWDKLLISDQPDQQYDLSIITRQDGPVNADDMMTLLAPLVANGSYRMLVERWGLQLPQGFLTSFNAP